MPITLGAVIYRYVNTLYVNEGCLTLDSQRLAINIKFDFVGRSARDTDKACFNFKAPCAGLAAKDSVFTDTAMA